MLGTYVVTNVSVYVWMILFELARCEPSCQSHLIVYNKTSNRNDLIGKTQKKLSFLQQLTDSVINVSGPIALLNVTTLAIVGDYLFPVNKDLSYLSWGLFSLELTLLLIVSDFVLYWSHRVQHMIEYLWIFCHRYHHQIDTPTAISTASIDVVDGSLQGGLPVLVALILVHPHPLSFYACVSLRFLDNVMNHSGINFAETSHIVLLEPSRSGTTLGSIALTLCRVLSVITLKNSALRASPRHHDYHHKFSNYSKNAKNFGEYFIVWDSLFGTLSAASMRAP